MSYKSNLFYQDKLDTAKKAYECQHCHRIFSDKRYLNTHLKRYNLHSDFYLKVNHINVNPYKCNICQKIFSKKQYLNYHCRTHTGEKANVCGFCKKAFTVKSSLLTHILIHTGEKPHVCNICDRHFRIKYSLRIHLLTHTGEKPYVCDYCQKAFSQKRHLNQHIFQHTGVSKNPRLLCSLCQKTFSSKFTFNNHIFSHTKKKYDVVHEKAADVETIDKHISRIKEKLFICKQCQAAFSVRSKLIRHLDTHAKEKPSVWDVCQKRLSEKKKL